MIQIAYICSHPSSVDSTIDQKENIFFFAHLLQHGFDVQWLPWDHPTVEWRQFQYVLLKAPWDYIDKLPAFYDWLSLLEQHGIPVLNPVERVRWNSQKTYLLDMAARGIEVIPTLVAADREAGSPSYFDIFHTDQIIVKPVVGSSAQHTQKFSRKQWALAEASLRASFHDKAFLVQPYVKEIVEQGEYSFIFFNGTFQFCILKKPRLGDFRVQTAFGGTHQLIDAPPHLQEAAQKIADQFAGDCLYARIDGVAVQDHLWLMELELIEPSLFLSFPLKGYQNYCDALVQKIQSAPL